MKAALLQTRHSLERDYQHAMLAYLKKPDESSLAAAYELGRRALEEGMGVVDIAALYDNALSRFLQNARTPTECSRTSKLLGRFFVESLSPFEMTHRGIRDAHTALRHLNEKLEAEARRIAHALHDEAGQLLVTVHFALENLAQDLSPDFAPRLQEVRHRLTEVEEQLRRLSHELRPPMLDDVGLVPALDFMAEGVSKRSGVSIEVNGRIPKRLPPMAEIALYRTVQEALTNAAKHAKASRVTVSLQEQQYENLTSIVCSVKDDGQGFETAAGSTVGPRRGLGLLGIEERIKALGGSVDIKSAPGLGTELLINVPCLD
jgi:signal transduction histidine kinase